MPAELDLNVPDGMALICRTCRWRPDQELTVGLVAAHFETEHDTDAVRLELVVLCPRCDTAMAFNRSEPIRSGGERDFFHCPACLRTRTVRRG